MKKTLLSALSLLIVLCAVSCRSAKEFTRTAQLQNLENSLREYIAGKDARIGVAVIIDAEDTVSVNGNRDFPMLSVYKFPQALAVADYCEKHGVNLTDTISIAKEEILTDTWSPMRDKYGVRDLRLPLSELLAFSVTQSDNNACDILFRLIGGPQAADSLMKVLGFGDIVIASTEKEMHAEPPLCYLNRSTPIAMATLFDRFYRGLLPLNNHVTEETGALMMNCNTGLNRLPAPLPDGARIGHKTGTGDTNSQGRIIAVNDAAFIILPSTENPPAQNASENPSHTYAVAIFIADSAYSLPETERIIADLSHIILRSLGHN